MGHIIIITTFIKLCFRHIKEQKEENDIGLFLLLLILIFVVVVFVVVVLVLVLVILVVTSIVTVSKK